MRQPRVGQLPFRQQPGIPPSEILPLAPKVEKVDFLPENSATCPKNRSEMLVLSKAGGWVKKRSSESAIDLLRGQGIGSSTDPVEARAALQAHS